MQSCRSLKFMDGKSCENTSFWCQALQRFFQCLRWKMIALDCRQAFALRSMLLGEAWIPWNTTCVHEAQSISFFERAPGQSALLKKGSETIFASSRRAIPKGRNVEATAFLGQLIFHLLKFVGIIRRHKKTRSLMQWGRLSFLSLSLAELYKAFPLNAKIKRVKRE